MEILFLFKVDPISEDVLDFIAQAFNNEQIHVTAVHVKTKTNSNAPEIAANTIQNTLESKQCTVETEIHTIPEQSKNKIREIIIEKVHEHNPDSVVLGYEPHGFLDRVQTKTLHEQLLNDHHIPVTLIPQQQNNTSD